MKKQHVFALAVLAEAVMLATYTSTAQAQTSTQNADSTPTREEHVLVTVPVHRQESQTAIPVTVLANDALREKAAGTLGETLSGLAGMSNASFGPAVGQPVIRGQQGARVTVLQNSTSVADVSNVSPDHAVASEAILAENVEILRGPSTLLYGGGAIGGVVNVLDNRIPQQAAEGVDGRVEFRHGSVNDENTAVAKLQAGSGNMAFYVDGLSRETNDMAIPGMAVREAEHHDEHDEEEEHHEEGREGVLENSYSETTSYTVGTSYLLDNGYIGFAVNQLDSDYGIPPGAHVHAEEEGGEEEEEHEGEHEGEQVRIDLEQTRYDFRLDLHDLGDSIEHLRWFVTYTDYQHMEYAIHEEHHDEGEEEEEEHEEHEEHETLYQSETWENRLELVHREWNGWHGALGVQLKQREFSAVGGESFIPQVDSDSVGVFVLEDVHTDFGLYELGLRVDRDSLTMDSLNEKASFTNSSFALSGLWDLSAQWKLGVAVSAAERAPTVEELYSNVGNGLGSYVVHGATQAIEVGQSTLEQEQSRSLDLSISFKSDSRDGFVTVFYNDFADYIYLEHTETEQDGFEVYQFVQDDATFSGIEAEFSQRFLNGELTFFGDKIEGELADGSDVPRMPAARIGMSFRYDFAGFTPSITAIHAFEKDAAESHEEEDVGEGEEEHAHALPTPSYTRIDLGVTAIIPSMDGAEAFVKVKNALDEDIRESTSFLRDIAPAAGRSFEAGVRFSF